MAKPATANRLENTIMYRRPKISDSLPDRMVPMVVASNQPELIQLWSGVESKSAAMMFRTEGVIPDPTPS